MADANNFNEGNGTDADSNLNDSSILNMSCGKANYPNLHSNASSDGPNTQAGNKMDK